MKTLEKRLSQINSTFDWKNEEVNKLEGFQLSWQLSELLPKAKKSSHFDSVNELKAYLLKRIEKLRTKQIDKITAEYNTIYSASSFKALKLNIEWKKSATWGSNPHATLQVWSETGYSCFTATASGCGYCKESAVMAQLFNQSSVLRKLACEAYDNGVETYGLREGFFSGGGVGVSSLQNAFKVLGLNLDKVASGKTFDAYSCEV